MATSAFRSTTKRATPQPKSSTSGDDSESSSSAPREYRSLSRFSHHLMPVMDAEVTPARKEKFVNNVRGSGFPDISLDDLAFEFFDSFSADSSGISGGERGRSGSRKFSVASDGDLTGSRRRGLSVSRASLGSGGSGVVQRLTVDTENSRQRRSVSRPPARGDSDDRSNGTGRSNSGRRRSVSRPPARCDAFDSGGGTRSANSRRRRSLSRTPAIGDAGDCGGGTRTANSRRRRSVSRPPASGDAGDCGGGTRTANSRRRRSMSRPPARGDAGDNSGGIGSSNFGRRRSVSRQPTKANSGDNDGGAGTTNTRRRRSFSVVRRRISDSESDVDHFQSSNNRGRSKSSVHRIDQITVSDKPVASVQRPGLRRSFSQNPMKCRDGFSSFSSAITDEEGKNTHSSKYGNERIIRAVYTQNKATTKTRKSLEDSDYGSLHKSIDPPHDITSITKDYATKLQESEERKRDLLAEILLEDHRGKELSKIVKELLTESNSDVSQKPSQTRKRSKDRSRISTCLTDEEEKYIEEFISNIEDTDFSSLDDERSETCSNFGPIKTDNSQSAAAPKCVVEADDVKLPWLQWETSSYSSPLPCQSKSPYTAITNSKIWEPADTTQDATSRQEMSIRSISSKESWNQGHVSSRGPRRLKIDVNDYLKRPNTDDFLYESWKLRHRIDSGSLVLFSRLFI